MKKGIVIKTTGSNYIVRDEQGNQENCYIKGKFKISGIKSTNPIAVGDRVEYIPESETSQGLICKIEPRKNYIIRKSAKLSKQTHIIASNLAGHKSFPDKSVKLILVKCEHLSDFFR